MLLLTAVALTGCFEGPSVSTETTGEDVAAPPVEQVDVDTARPTGTADDVPASPSTTKPLPATTTTSTTEPDDEADDETPSDGHDDGEGGDEADDGDGTGGDDDSSGGGNGGGNEPGTGGYAAGSVTYVNERRQAAGMSGLAVDDDLTAMAEAWTRQMIAEQNLYHNPNLGQQRPARFRIVGENIAYSNNPANIDGMWWDSDGHRENILNSSYTHIGVAFIQDDRGVTWATQVFAG